MDKDKYQIVNKKRKEETKDLTDIEYINHEELNQKHNNKNGILGFGVILVVVLILAFVCGDFIFKFVMKDIIVDKNKDKIINKDEVISHVQNNIEGKDVKSFYVIQCGVFKEKSNAQDLYIKLKKYGIPFVYKEDLYRVYFGIYEEEASISVGEFLEEKGFETARVIFNTVNDTEEQMVLNEIIMALLKINWKIENEGLEELKSESLKAWCKTINLEQYPKDEFNDIKLIVQDIMDLPSAITKEKAEYIYLKLFGILNKY